MSMDDDNEFQMGGDEFAWADETPGVWLPDEGSDDEAEYHERLTADIAAGKSLSIDEMATATAYIERRTARAEASTAEAIAQTEKIKADAAQAKLVEAILPAMREIGFDPSINVPRIVQRAAEEFASTHPDFDVTRRGAAHHLIAWMRREKYLEDGA
jgi:hypothetical protein